MVATVKVLCADKTIQTIDATNPLAVSLVAGGGNSQALSNTYGTVAAVGPTALIAAPGAGLRIVVVSFVVQNESATATTIRLISGASGNGWRVLCQNQGDGLSKDFQLGYEWRLGLNSALNILLSGANTCNYSIMYFVE